MADGRYRNDDPNDLTTIVADLKRRVSALERVPRLQNTGLDRGDVIITGGGFVFSRTGNTTGDQGYVTVGTDAIIDGLPAVSMSMFRSQAVHGADTFFGTNDTVNGNKLLWFLASEGNTPGFYFPTLGLYDKSGQPLLQDSYNARRGFSDPILPVGWSLSGFVSTTNTVAEQFAEGEWYAYHPHIRFRLLIQNDVGNVSVITITDLAYGGIIKTYTSASGEFAYVDIVVARSAFRGTEYNGNPVLFAVNHRRSSGAGTVRSRVTSIVGIDLSLTLPY